MDSSKRPDSTFQCNSSPDITALPTAESTKYSALEMPADKYRITLFICSKVRSREPRRSSRERAICSRTRLRYQVLKEWFSTTLHYQRHEVVFKLMLEGCQDCVARERAIAAGMTLLIPSTSSRKLENGMVRLAGAFESPSLRTSLTNNWANASSDCPTAAIAFNASIASSTDLRTSGTILGRPLFVNDSYATRYSF